jgi:hypothetical protein
VSPRSQASAIASHASRHSRSTCSTPSDRPPSWPVRIGCCVYSPIGVSDVRPLVPTRPRSDDPGDGGEGANRDLHRRTRRGRIRCGVVAAAITLFGCCPGACFAATFYETPPTANPSGAGPFTFAARSDGGAGPNGWIAYKIPGGDWQRCQHTSAQFSVPSLADGTYTVMIADDISLDYWGNIGQLYSGHTAGCDTHDPPDTQITGYTFTIGPMIGASPTAPAVSPPPPAATPIPQRGPAAFTWHLADANAATRHVIRNETHHTPMNLSRSCARTALDSFKCRVSWFDAKWVWAGTLKMTAGSTRTVVAFDEFDGLRASRACVRRKSVRRCKHTASF